MMGTASTMCIIAETLGMSLPGNSTTSALSDSLRELAKTAGKQILNLWQEGVTARKILTPSAVENAIKVAMAIGGSTNTLMHIPAIATEAELNMDCGKVFDKGSHIIPLLMGISPNGDHLMEDFDRAGGLGALCQVIFNHLDLDCLTVTGDSIGQNIHDCFVKDDQVIRSLDNPISTQGALAVLHGNIAPDGALIKQSAVPSNLMKFRGPAKVYHSNEGAIDALRNGEIKSGDAVVIIFQGAKGGPGVVSTFPFTSELAGSKLWDSVALITDGRFSGATEGACIGYASPEAALYGPILAIQNGDIIEYDIPNRTLNAVLSQEEIEQRLERAQVNIDIKRGYLGIYQNTVRSVLKGAVLSGRD
jgi:dihydroxy-acid dehydratase